MDFAIYDIVTTRFVRIMRNGYWQDATYKTEAAAKTAFTRLVKQGKIKPASHAIAPLDIFHQQIEKKETKTNLLSGKTFEQSVNTPLCCDPSSETYWSM